MKYTHLREGVKIGRKDRFDKSIMNVNTSFGLQVLYFQLQGA